MRVRVRVRVGVRVVGLGLGLGFGFGLATCTAFLLERSLRKEVARPLCPARPVRPMRWT